MSKTSSSLRSAIQDLNIQKPLQVRQTRAPEMKDAHSEVPETERPKSETINGFFMMAHRIFSESAIRDLPGDCFRVFLWMSAQAYRFKTSKGTVRASAKFVSAGVGVAESSVSRSFEALLKAKLIKRIEINYKLGNLWWVDPIAFAGENYERPETEGTRNDVPETRSPHSEGDAALKRGTQSPNLGQQVSENGGEIKNFQDSKTEHSLSSYFEGLKPERKRLSEKEAYQSLKRDYSDDDILEALAALQIEDPEQSKYHSPMSYLSVSIEQVLRKAKQAKSIEAEKMAKKLDRQRLEKIAFETEQREEEEWKERERLFHEAFPTSEMQRAAVDEYSTGIAFAGESSRRGLAISRWWESYGSS